MFQQKESLIFNEVFIKPPKQTSKGNKQNTSPAFFPTTGTVTGAAMGAGGGSTGGGLIIFTSAKRCLLH